MEFRKVFSEKAFNLFDNAYDHVLIVPFHKFLQIAQCARSLQGERMLFLRVIVDCRRFVVRLELLMSVAPFEINAFGH